jgi:hypothetical protein
MKPLWKKRASQWFMFVGQDAVAAEKEIQTDSATNYLSK